MGSIIALEYWFSATKLNGIGLCLEIFDFHNGLGVVSLEVRDAPKHPTMLRTSTTQQRIIYLVQNINTEAEDPCSGIMKIMNALLLCEQWKVCLGTHILRDKIYF